MRYTIIAHAAVAMLEACTHPGRTCAAAPASGSDPPSCRSTATTGRLSVPIVDRRRGGGHRAARRRRRVGVGADALPPGPSRPGTEPAGLGTAGPKPGPARLGPAGVRRPLRSWCRSRRWRAATAFAARGVDERDHRRAAYVDGAGGDRRRRPPPSLAPTPRQSTQPRWRSRGGWAWGPPSRTQPVGAGPPPGRREGVSANANASAPPGSPVAPATPSMADRHPAVG